MLKKPLTPAQKVKSIVDDLICAYATLSLIQNSRNSKDVDLCREYIMNAKKKLTGNYDWEEKEK